MLGNEALEVLYFCSFLYLRPELFGDVDFKLTDNLPKGQSFPALKTFPVSEIVNYGLGQNQPSLKNGGIHLNSTEYHKKMTESNTVIVDVRNTYEGTYDLSHVAAIGRFQPPPGGAEYIDPKMRVSSKLYRYFISS